MYWLLCAVTLNYFWKIELKINFSNEFGTTEGSLIVGFIALTTGTTGLLFNMNYDIE